MTAPNLDMVPLEMRQHIASFLENDSDICNFRRICRSTLQAVDADNCSFWRRRFLSQFEKPAWTQANNVEYKSAYQRRKTVLKHGVRFQTGGTARERAYLEVLRDLIVESYSGRRHDNKMTYESMNMKHIERFLNANNILEIIFKPTQLNKRGGILPTTNPLLTTLQVVCAPMLLTFHIKAFYYGLDTQMAVYSDPIKCPIFTGCHGLDVDMTFILHNINFWMYHIACEQEQTLVKSFSELRDDEKPRWWYTQPGQGAQTLGKHWKGSYAYVDRLDMEPLRTALAACLHLQILDNFAGEEDGNNFQDLKLEIVNEGFTWPQAFEEHLRSLTLPPNRAKTRAQKRCAAPDENLKSVSFHFEGEGQDTKENFFAAGWLNTLPLQHGVPGWQRVTMMKYFRKPYTNEIDQNSLWAYEGVVLPGGQIMLGRWWCPNDGEEVYSGPFILWCVDGPKYAESENDVAGTRI